MPKTVDLKHHGYHSVTVRELKQVTTASHHVIVSMTLVGQNSRHRYRIIVSFVDASTRAVQSVADNAFLHAPEAEMLADEGRHLAEAVLQLAARIIAIQSFVVDFFSLSFQATTCDTSFIATFGLMSTHSAATTSY